MNVRMRDDLALRGDLVPAFESVVYPDEGVGLQYLTAFDLDGAICLPDVNKDEYNFNRIKLKTGNVFFMRSIDLDWN